MRGKIDEGASRDSPHLGAARRSSPGMRGNPRSSEAREIDEVLSDSPRLGSPPRASAVIRAVQVVVNNSCIINVVVLQ